MITPKELRRHLHRHPELSFQEHDTAASIGAALTKAGIAWQPIAHTGILARIEGRGDLHRAVVLRADIDALPIEEQSGVEWCSTHAGVMHACGHDMHAAILYGVLCRLKEGNFSGTLFGLFQPGEECNPGGASLVLKEDPFADYQVKAVVGQHVEPDLEVGTFGFKAGKYMAANDELRFRICGEGGHAALRSRICDTVRSAARLVVALTDLNTPEQILSIGRMEGLGATNVIPDEVRLEGTMRTFDETVRQQLKAKIETLCRAEEEASRSRIAIDIREGYPCVTNDEQLTREAAALADQLACPWQALTLRPTSEDFGWYGTRYPALFYRLGVGAKAGRTHTAYFNPDEGALEIGQDFMAQLALKLLNR